MGKTYLSTVKYLIKTKFTVEGIVDKHDIIGAVFGQSEGLMGEDMDLKELQKAGKLGRIEVDATSHSGKTSGTLLVPSGMDKVKTSLLAAAIESVDKVGPCDSSFQTIAIEDTRGEKRKIVTERAKELLQKMGESLPESEELRATIVGDLRGGELQEYGRERLPAGPDVDKEDEVIVVEGRADVLNLLRHGIKNCIAINGATVPKTVVELGKRKTLTVFVDGDRGGLLIARQLSQATKIANIAKAPAGKEVEELTMKEILAALRKKRPGETRPIRGRLRGTYSQGRSYGEKSRGSRGFRTSQRSDSRGPRRARTRMDGRSPIRRRASERFSSERAVMAQQPNDLGEFNQTMQELGSSLRARFLDEKMKTMKEVSVRDLLEEMKKQKNVYAIVFDGIVTKRLAEQAEKSKVQYLVGVKRGKVGETGKVKILSLF